MELAMNEKNFAFENEDMIFHIEDDIAIIKFKADSFKDWADIQKVSNIISICQWVEKDPKVNVFVMMNDPTAFDETAYASFMDALYMHKNPLEDENALTPENKLVRARQMNNLRNFISLIVDSQKLTVACLSGTVVTPFFGVAMAFDFRYMAEDAKFSLLHNKFNQHPTGGGPFFLGKYVTRPNAMEIMFNCKEVPAHKALDYGLLNGVLPVEGFEQKSLELVKNMNIPHPHVMRSTKRLMGNFKRELDAYFDEESHSIGF